MKKSKSCKMRKTKSHKMRKTKSHKMRKSGRSKNGGGIFRTKKIKCDNIEDILKKENYLDDYELFNKTYKECCPTSSIGVRNSNPLCKNLQQKIKNTYEGDVMNPNNYDEDVDM
jgi:hypothetical protein